MSKAEIITKIKSIINNYGTFTTAEVEAESSPCIATLGSNTCQLAESFNNQSVEAVTYNRDIEIDSERIGYESLEKDVLAEILELAEKWETICKDEE